MSTPVLFKPGQPAVIAALHLPPLPASHHPAAQPVSKVVEIALRNAEKAVKAGIPALYIQDLGDFPLAPHVQPHTVAILSVVGAAIRREFPGLALGVCMMSHAAREPLAVAQAIGAQFVRLKVYVGAMVKAEGILQGCAYEAIQYRAAIDAEEIKILADVYDRTGEPLGRLPIAEEARQAAVYGRADGLVLTGLSFAESLQMLADVRAAKLNTPLLLGGGATAENIAQVLKVADGVVVSSAFKTTSGWTREAMLAEWDADRVNFFMQAVRRAAGEGNVADAA
jgi:membrane complex biogenesis BtpA family protein